MDGRPNDVGNATSSHFIAWTLTMCNCLTSLDDLTISSAASPRKNCSLQGQHGVFIAYS